MAPYAVQITLSQPWKGLEEEFSHVFHYDSDVLVNLEAGWNDLVDAIVVQLRPLYANSVKFVRARVHGPTHLTKIEDEMRFVKDLTGTGSVSVGALIPPELAVVAQCYVGRGPKGGKQILRKYVHSQTLPQGSAGSSYERAQAKLPQLVKDQYITRFNNLKNVAIGANSVAICTPEGKHLPIGSTWTVLDYVATRQFRRRSKRRKPLN